MSLPSAFIHRTMKRSLRAALTLVMTWLLGLMPLVHQHSLGAHASRVQLSTTQQVASQLCLADSVEEDACELCRWKSTTPYTSPGQRPTNLSVPTRLEQTIVQVRAPPFGAFSLYNNRAPPSLIS